MYKLYYGTDPEVFASYSSDVNYDNFLSHKKFAYSPAALRRFEGVMPVFDDIKHPIFLEKENFRIIMDGAAFELNFKHPFQDPKEMYDTVQQSLATTNEFINSLGYTMFSKPVINFDYRQFWSEQLEGDILYMQGVIFGCDTDYDALHPDWHSEIIDASKHPYRYGGGHLHISGMDEISENILVFIRLMAIFVGNYCIANSLTPELDQVRGHYYGMPTKYRRQYYSNGSSGAEYRTPSSGWLSFNEDQFMGMMDNVQKAVWHLLHPKDGARILDEYEELTGVAIKNADTELASSIISKL